MVKPILYIAGPMSGYPEYNYPSFNKAAKALRALGYGVHNPARSFDEDLTMEWPEYIRAALHLVLQSDGLVLLPGWRESTGANLELAVALAIDIPVMVYPSMEMYSDGPVF